MDSTSFLSQEDSFRDVLPRIGNAPWLLACFSRHEETPLGVAMCGFYSALIPKGQIKRSLQSFSWDLSKGDGIPAFRVSSNRIGYLRFGNDSGVEPLVFARHYHGLRPSHIEVAEEFRHFHELFLDSSGNLIRFDYDDGSEEIVGRPVPDGYELRMREVREFLAAKGMYLAQLFDISRIAKDHKQDVPERSEERRDPATLLSYTFSIRNGVSRLVGKRLIKPLPKREIGKWPYNERRKQKETYEKFIIGSDADGRPVQSTCNPEKLGNYFGKNPGAPQYMTPVFFERSVLQPYFEQPDKYVICDGYLKCGGLWLLHIDNDHKDRVVVALGDLGRDLPKRERGRWKALNVVPDGRGYSKTAFNRAFKAEFANPTRADLRFKSLFGTFLEKWAEIKGWHLFLPLKPADSHFFTSLRIPLHDNQREFDGQVLALAKLVVDSLNEKELRTRAGRSDDDPALVRSLVLLERFLQASGIPDSKQHVDRLRLVQKLRSTGAAHRKGDEYQKLSEKLALDRTPSSKTFETLLDGCSALLVALMPP